MAENLLFFHGASRMQVLDLKGSAHRRIKDAALVPLVIRHESTACDRRQGRLVHRPLRSDPQHFRSMAGSHSATSNSAYTMTTST
jgi:hypothetical protein